MEKKKETDPARIQLIVGVLGFLGVLLGVLATIFAPIIQKSLLNNDPTQTPVVIVATPTGVLPADTPKPTDTVPPNAPTSTPAPTDTPTPEPTFTPVPLAAGKDWLDNCISVVWKMYPESTTTNNDGSCYSEPVANAFTIRSQRFNLFYEDKPADVELVGMFVEVPSDAVVEITMHIEEISVGELWVGVMGESNFDAKGIVAVAPQGNANNSAFSIREPNGKELSLTNKFKKDDGNYLISFDVSPNSVSLTLDKYTSFNPIAVPSEKKWLFVGYRVIGGSTNHVEGGFFDLKITPR